MNREEVNAIIAEMERLGESKSFTEAERMRLQEVFTDGTLSKDICWLGWTEYKDKDGKTHYTKSFSDKEWKVMEQICNERINAAKERIVGFYENFSLEKLSEEINKEIMCWRKVDAKSTEWERMKKHAQNSVAKVENGRLNLESGYPSYDCVVVRENDWYSGSIKIKKTDYGYEAEVRVPMAGGMSCRVPKDEIFKYIKEWTRYIVS